METINKHLHEEWFIISSYFSYIYIIEIIFRTFCKNVPFALLKRCNFDAISRIQSTATYDDRVERDRWSRRPFLLQVD